LRGAKDECQVKVVGALRLQRTKDYDGARVLAQLRVAVGEQGSDSRIVGSAGVQAFQFDGCGAEVALLIERKREVQADGVVARIGLERASVFADGFVKAAEMDQRGAEIRARIGEIGMRFEELAVVTDSSGEITPLLGIDRGAEELVDIGVLRESGSGED
jgi:hypothetical protein